MTASGFHVVSMPPLLGRVLVPGDERQDAARVIVIGYDVWQSRFGGDRSVIGRTLQLDETPYIIVGVMPDGFRFPVNNQFWIPLQVDPSDYPRDDGPGFNVFGRLAPGVILEQAQAELATIEPRIAGDSGETDEQLRPQVIPYTLEYFDVDSSIFFWWSWIFQLLLSMLLLVVAVNVAVVIYARTAARRGEIAVRIALGASRRRVVAQLFVEAFVLSAVAALTGIALAWGILGRVRSQIASDEVVASALPFWFDLSLSARAVIYAFALALLAAMIIGILPGLKTTGRWLQSDLRELGSSTGTQLGRTWSILIVTQVAFTMAVLPAVLTPVWEATRAEFSDPGFPVDRFIVADVAMTEEMSESGPAPADSGNFRIRLRAWLTELTTRLMAESGVSAVTFSSDVPGWGETRPIELEASATMPEAATSEGAHVLRVGLGFFEAYDGDILAGHAFNASDLNPGATSVIVNRSFVEEFLGDGSALGRRIRYSSADEQDRADQWTPGSWYEIVGVVNEIPAYPLDFGTLEFRTNAAVYHAAAPGAVHPVELSIRFDSAVPAGFSQQMREIITELGSTLQLRGVRSLAEVYESLRFLPRVVVGVLALMELGVLLLSGAGIFALMSFAVVQRRPEIGIRSALGGQPYRILSSVLARALRQLVLGVAAGGAVAVLLDVSAGGGILNGKGLILLPVAAAVILAVGLIAAFGPIRRGLSIQPTEALRAE